MLVIDDALRLDQMDLGWGWSVEGEACSSHEVWIEYQSMGQRHLRALPDVGSVNFTECLPVRDFPQWPGKRHYDGALWMASTGTSVAFESLNERSFLMELDRRGDVMAVSSQPMWIKWDDARGSRHAPDYFVKLRGDHSVVVDVKSRHQIADPKVVLQFDRTAQLCAEAGWGYAVYLGNSVTRDANLRFLRRYRDPRWAAELGTFDVPSSPVHLRQAVKELGGGDLGLARCYLLIWKGELMADLEEPLSPRSVLIARSAE